MPILTRGRRLALPLLLATLSACRDGTGSGDGGAGKDRVAPVAEITFPTGAGRTPTQLWLMGRATDDVAVTRATFQVDGGPERAFRVFPGSPAPGTRDVAFDATLSLPAGTYSVVVHAYDAAGNRGSSPALGFQVDGSAPQVNLATPAALTVAADTVRVRATVTDDYNLGSVQVSALTQGNISFIAANKGKVTQHVVDTLVSLRVGDNEIAVVARDSVGNETRARIVATRTAATVPSRFDAVVAYNRHGCGLRAGAAYCWGDGNLGELGNGRAISRDTPVPVAGGLTFSSLSAGSGRSCGVTTAGEAYCWGNDFFGALGQGTSTPGFHAAPQRVAAQVRFASISAGTSGNTACAVAVTGEAYCWGINSSGQAGVPRSTGTCTAGTTVAPCVVTPARVQGGLRFTSVSAGGSTSCGIAEDGRAYCWGSGLLGTGEANALSETPVPVAGGLTFGVLSVGAASVCGLTTAGEAYCWGSNYGGALGDGTSENRAVPTRVATTMRFRSIGVVPVVTGNEVGAGACARADDGAVYCWGSGRPFARLEGGLAFTSVSPNHRCGVTADRAAYCWTLISGPVPVPGEYP